MTIRPPCRPEDVETIILGPGRRGPAIKFEHQDHEARDSNGLGEQPPTP